ncbi:MAG: hypothetical protein OXI53_01840 [Nitrospira sp.]|nr:hypothetical protein [Nitrospira sp.]MDE0404036.1 hypothetical protein [Nitrospira sp.]MDE0486586.1 hypothetical protein [Nitrospira sp.]
MDIESFAGMWGYLTWLPKWLLRRKFSEECMANLVKVDIFPRHENVSVNLSRPFATFQLWFEVTNMSPFDVELDRAQIEFCCSGTPLHVPYIKKIKIKAGETEKFHVDGDIPDNKADQIACFYDKADSSMSMDVYFNCRLHNFAKIYHRLDGITPRFINEHVRSKNEIK